MRLSSTALRKLRRGVPLALVAALGAMMGCGGHPVNLTMNDFEKTGTVHGHWQFGRPMWLVMQMPSFNHDVHVTDLTFELSSGHGTIDGSEEQVLVLATGPYRGLTLSYDLDTEGGRLVPLDKMTVKAGVHPELALVALINSSTPGCHEAQLVLRVKAGDTQRTFRPRWYVGLDTGLSNGRGERYCDATPAPFPTTSNS